MKLFGISFLAVALLLPAGTLAQSPEASQAPAVPQVLCLRVLAPEGLNAVTFTEGVRSGLVNVLALVPCDAGDVSPSPSPAASPEASSLPTSDAPLPVEVVDKGFTAEEYGTWAVVLRNPNPTGWAVDRMNVTVDFLDKNGDLVDTEESSITLVPGQTSAIYGTFDDLRGTKSMVVTPSNADDDWTELDFEPGSFSFERVKTKKNAIDYPVTTGMIVSNFADRMDDVSVIAVYKNRSGKILGASGSTVDHVDAGKKSSFKVDAFGEFKGRSSVDMYWQP